MTISSYFHHTNSSAEHQLMDDLSRETIQLKGLDFAYIPRDSSDADSLFGEDVKSTFDASVTLEMYCKQQTGFEGEGDFFSKFGLDIRDEAVFQINKNRFTEVVTAVYPSITRPREGDLIYYALAKSLLEISFVEKEKPFYLRGIQTLWECNVRKFEYNHDEMVTGITEVDAIETEPDTNDDSAVVQIESDEVMNFDEHDPFSTNDY